MRPQVLVTLLLSCFAVQGQHFRHHHPNPKLNALHQLIQKRNNTPIESAVPKGPSSEPTVRPAEGASNVNQGSFESGTASALTPSSVGADQQYGETVVVTATLTARSDSTSRQPPSAVPTNHKTSPVPSILDITLGPGSTSPSVSDPVTSTPSPVPTNHKTSPVPSILDITLDPGSTSSGVFEPATSTRIASNTGIPSTLSSTLLSSTTLSPGNIGAQLPSIRGSHVVEPSTPEPTYIGAPGTSTVPSTGTQTAPVTNASHATAASGVQASASPSIEASSVTFVAPVNAVSPNAPPVFTTSIPPTTATNAGLSPGLSSGLSTPNPPQSILPAPAAKETSLTYPSIVPGQSTTSQTMVGTTMPTTIVPIANSPVPSASNTSIPTSSATPKAQAVAPTTISTSPEVTTGRLPTSTGLRPSTTNQTVSAGDMSRRPPPSTSLPENSATTDTKHTVKPSSVDTKTSSSGTKPMASPVAPTLPSTIPISTTQTMELPQAVLTATSASTTTPSADATSLASQARTSATSSPVLPAAIAPAAGIIMPNSSQTIVQVGFLDSLNYPFVVSNALATAQILAYTPKAVAYALGLPQSGILANSLRPYNKPDYVATVAYLVIPSADLSQLEELWNNTNSVLYNQLDPSLQSLVVLIDRSIPLLLSSSRGSTTTNAGNTASGGAASDASTARYGSLADTGPSSGTTSSTTRIVGIGVGSAAAAGMYAGAMFLVARRHRSRRMTLFARDTARGRRGISRPMNPENSLGI
ncbi:Putative uncharacterized protein [Taphrina deformans PYCC 5710]|uniref:Mucin family signaling protein Msb2 n=1 Tax=Taphrina deformans (strain PYCC 5710 / ATCC 11124 / CBS 356.35 / IMI 108563 / JCM 9778 / NBRC 8474) TaxID=1097556 RepID=R4X9N6_TAPDE|nr:Putative uncharacterized protein [Taphrina deformans PYCC 5710]|eukprot:CCG80949.1 Putative uncharacterized protein [Taphrina deformans PYCC 5710]